MSGLENKNVIYFMSLYDKNKLLEQLSVMLVLPRQFVKSLQIVLPYFAPATMEVCFFANYFSKLASRWRGYACNSRNSRKDHWMLHAKHSFWSSAMHSRRIEMLSPLLKEISPQHYKHFLLQVTFELAETESDIFDNLTLKLGMNCKKKPSVSKMNSTFVLLRLYSNFSE